MEGRKGRKDLKHLPISEFCYGALPVSKGILGAPRDASVADIAPVAMELLWRRQKPYLAIGQIIDKTCQYDRPFSKPGASVAPIHLTKFND